MLDGLVATDGPAALHAHAGVLHAELEDALGRAGHLRAAGQGADAECGGEQRPAVSRRAEQILARALDVGEIELEELVAGHAVEGTRDDARAVHREQQRGGPGAGPSRARSRRSPRARPDEELAPGQAAGSGQRAASARPGRAGPTPPAPRRAQIRSPRARAGSSARAFRPPAAASAVVATSALAMNGLGKQARPISSTRASASPIGAAAAAELDGNQETRPAERRDLLPEIGREAARVEGELLDAPRAGSAAAAARGPIAAGAAARART